MSCILSGDIGGTKTWLRLSQHGAGVIRQHAYASQAWAGLDAMLADFLGEANHFQIEAACFALAGPVASRRVVLTNLPWQVDADALADRFAIPYVALVNDFEAVGYGISGLRQDDLLTLQTGSERAEGVRIVAGAGTGLGVAWLSWQDGRYVVHPSEGGHLDFAPSSRLEFELLEYLQQRHGRHVSYERIVSGPGLLAIYEFLRDGGHATPSPRLLDALMQGDASATLAGFAELGGEPIADHALELFVKIYGAFAGNMALAALPRGGVYIAGGIAAKIAQRMQQGEFLRAFLDKGRFAGLLATLPLHIVLEPEVGLLGAEQLALRYTEKK